MVKVVQVVDYSTVILTDIFVIFSNCRKLRNPMNNFGFILKMSRDRYRAKFKPNKSTWLLHEHVHPLFQVRLTDSGGDNYQLWIYYPEGATQAGG